MRADLANHASTSCDNNFIVNINIMHSNCIFLGNNLLKLRLTNMKIYKIYIHI